MIHRDEAARSVGEGANETERARVRARARVGGRLRGRLRGRVCLSEAPSILSIEEALQAKNSLCEHTQSHKKSRPCYEEPNPAPLTLTLTLTPTLTVTLTLTLVRTLPLVSHCGGRARTRGS